MPSPAAAPKSPTRRPLRRPRRPDLAPASHRNQCPDRSGFSARVISESVPRSRRNRCPDATGIRTQGAAGLAPRKVGRRAKLDAKDRLNAQLLKRTAVLERKLHIAEAVIALQKQAHEILGIALPALDDET